MCEVFYKHSSFNLVSLYSFFFTRTIIFIFFFCCVRRSHVFFLPSWNNCCPYSSHQLFTFNFVLGNLFMFCISACGLTALDWETCQIITETTQRFCFYEEHNARSRPSLDLISCNQRKHKSSPLSGQTEDYEIGICCFSAKHAAEFQDGHHHRIKF